MNDAITRLDLGGGIAGIQLERPPVNALNPEFLDLIDTTLAEVGQDDGVCAIVLSSGLKVFSAGMDLKEVRDFEVSQQTAVVDGLNRMLCRLYGLDKPVVAAVNGAAIAGGLFFVLAADYAVTRPGAMFGLTEVRAGVSFPVAPLEIACAELSPVHVRRLMLSGEVVDSESALNMGIVHAVVPAEEVASQAAAMAKDLGSLSNIAFRQIKTQLRASALERIEECIASGNDPTRSGWFSEQTPGAMDALLAAATRR